MPDLRDRNSRVVQQRARELANEAYLATLREDESGPDQENDTDIDTSFGDYDLFVRSHDDRRQDLGDDDYYYELEDDFYHFN